jgi:hypothetical protein
MAPSISESSRVIRILEQIKNDCARRDIALIAAARLDPRMTGTHPSEAQRDAAWAACAARWFDNAHPLVHLSLELLGHAERPILRLEAALRASVDGRKPQRDRLLLECSALSIYWLFGL